MISRNIRGCLTKLAKVDGVSGLRDLWSSHGGKGIEPMVCSEPLIQCRSTLLVQTLFVLMQKITFSSAVRY